MLLWRGRSVIPESLCHTILQLLHDGYPSVRSMRKLVKFYAWWPKIDNEIEHWVAACTSCQKIQSEGTGSAVVFNMNSRPSFFRQKLGR